MEYTKKELIEQMNRLVDEGKNLAKKIKKESNSNDLKIETQAWITQVQNIFHVVFGQKSVHTNHLYNVYQKVHFTYDFQIYPIIGVLKGAIDDIENGFLDKIEKRIEISLSDDILLQSKNILDQGNKDISAILNRIILERIIKRDARDNGIKIDNRKTSVLNNKLKENNIYKKPKWRQIQTYLDVGNSAAHGSFEDYDFKIVNKMIEFVEDLLINQ